MARGAPARQGARKMEALVVLLAVYIVAAGFSL